MMQPDRGCIKYKTRAAPTSEKGLVLTINTENLALSVIPDYLNTTQNIFCQLCSDTSTELEP